MKIFKLREHKVWHIAHPRDGIAYCYNARIDKSWYTQVRDTSDFEVKERDGEFLCHTCVGMAYQAGAIEVMDNEVAE
ncbi:hypothetical protein [Jeotgalibaca porci]|uniref:hypothetical protein n=1 Tax=Jeotgalibaca porci TaxID=1868793 RepID=UPI0035A06C73